jgi:hypothetical protein
VIDFDYECGGWLVLGKGIETNTMFFHGAKQHHIKYLEDMSGARSKCNDSDPLTCENCHNSMANVK